MRTRGILLFLTFVLVCSFSIAPKAWAAKPKPTVETEENKSDLDESARETTELEAARAADTVDIAPAPPASARTVKYQNDFFYAYRKSLSALAGVASSSETRNETNTPAMGTILFSFVAPNLKTYEAGADLLSNGVGALHISQRWVLARTEFRPYFKAGLGVVTIPEDRLATFIRYENFRLQGGTGFEYSVTKPMSLRFELNAALSAKAFQAGIVAGGTWAW